VTVGKTKVVKCQAAKQQNKWVTVGEVADSKARDGNAKERWQSTLQVVS